MKSQVLYQAVTAVGAASHLALITSLLSHHDNLNFQYDAKMLEIIAVKHLRLCLDTSETMEVATLMYVIMSLMVIQVRMLSSYFHRIADYLNDMQWECERHQGTRQRVVTFHEIPNSSGDDTYPCYGDVHIVSNRNQMNATIAH